ncbi:MAG: DNA topoisomerase [Ruminococcaceae bacterium]|nr:DNA topoisomerase [Oscillospiraceae bacterium]
MAKKTTEYGNQSISSLKGADRVRKRPAVIFGSDGLEGCEHSVFEILSNSVDEAREGYGKIIRITAYNDHSIEIEDDGRGVPLGYNEKEGRYNWELVYCELYAGGKYDNNDKNASYGYSLGLNGLGACATQYSSEYMDVYSFDGENVHEIHFRKGEPKGKLTTSPLEKGGKKHGTVQHWKPDLEVFTDINIPKEYYLDMLKRQSVVNAGVKFLFKWQNADGSFETHEFLYPNGIADYMNELVGEASLTAPVFWSTETTGRDREDMEDYKLKYEIIFCFSQSVSVVEHYHNASYLEHGGSPDKAVREGFRYAIDRYLKENGKYNKNDTKITVQDVLDCLVIITNSFSTRPSYANQTKKAITNTFIASSMTEFIKSSLEIYFKEKPLEAEKIANQVMVNKKSREQSEATRLDIKKKLTGTMDIANRVEKFVNCRSKDPSRRELYIVEGDSAMTSCKLGRAAEFQAIIPVRGKTLNCLKSTYDKIFKSDIIVDLLRVIGCGVEIKGKVKGNLAPFDLESLNWSKIIICTDADEDGYQIRTLILTLFYRLLPTLIREGRVYIAESPLFEINTKNDTFFAYNEEEKEEILSQIGSEKFTVQRSKGLGENEPDMMWKTTMNPATRRLIRVSEADAQQTEWIFNTLLGDDLPERKKFIRQHGNLYAAEADV